MKNSSPLIVAVVAFFVLAGGSTPTPSYALDLEEDMTEDIILTAAPEDDTQYQYDSSNDSASEFIGEWRVMRECEPSAPKFAGDSAPLYPENYMVDGLFYEDSEKNMSEVLNKYGAPAAGEEKE